MVCYVKSEHRYGRVLTTRPGECYVLIDGEANARWYKSKDVETDWS